MTAPRLLAVTDRRIGASSSPIGFATTGGDTWPVWDRFLTVGGVPAYEIGNICGTCAYWFTRLDGAEAVDVAALTGQLAEGLDGLDRDTIDVLAPLFPPGDYRVALIELVPVLVEPGSPADYFTVEQPANEDWDDAEDLHDPRVAYFRTLGRSDLPIEQDGLDGRLFEFIVPMARPDMLDPSRVDHYADALMAGTRPTAVAIGVLDIKGPASSGLEHWCLGHYLIDGHHKLMAAARTGRPIVLISFIAVEQGISRPEHVDAVLATYGQREAAA